MSDVVQMAPELLGNIFHNLFLVISLEFAASEYWVLFWQLSELRT